MILFTRLVNMGFDPCKPIGVMVQAITPESDGDLQTIVAQFGLFIKDIPPEKKASAPIDDYDPQRDLCLRLICDEPNMVAIHRLIDGAGMCACQKGTWFAFQTDDSVTIFSQEQGFLSKVSSAMAYLEGAAAGH